MMHTQEIPIVDSSSRDSRISFRVPSKQAALLRRAAEASDTTLTDFVLSSASIAAQHALADRRWFELDSQSWASFEAALDRPAIYKPRLSETAKDDSFFDD